MTFEGLKIRTAGTLGRPRGMVRGGEEGGGFRMGNMYILVVDSCWYMAKPIHIVKLKNKIIRKNFGRGNTQDTYLTEMSSFIWNLNFTGDPLFHLATLLRASYCTIKSSLMEGGDNQQWPQFHEEVLKTNETCIHWIRTTQRWNLSQTQATLK